MSEESKSRPWYREPWPWILMSGPALAVVASFASAYLAVHGADPVVDENYYQHGLQINAELARDQQAHRMNLRSDLQLSGVRRGDEVRLRLTSAQPLPDTAVRIRLLHDGGAFSERSAVLGRVPGTSGAPAFYGQWLQAPDDRLTLADGRWRVVLEGDDWRIEGSAGADAHLSAP
jgi:uncharacterized protein